VSFIAFNSKGEQLSYNILPSRTAFISEIFSRVRFNSLTETALMINILKANNMYHSLFYCIKVEKYISIDMLNPDLITRNRKPLLLQ